VAEPKINRQTRGAEVARVYENGEFVENKPAQRRKRKGRKGVVMYAMVELEALQKVPKSLNGTEQRILNLVLSDYNPPEQTWARMTPTEMAALLDLDRNFVYATIRERRRFLFRISRTAWFVSPHYGFRGAKSDWIEALETTDEPEW
jgi:hypothetical protein